MNDSGSKINNFMADVCMKPGFPRTGQQEGFSNYKL